MARDPADLRKSFDGLAALVRNALRADPLCGHLFVFRNKRGDRLKILAWDHDGWTIFYKRLEQGVSFGALKPATDRRFKPSQWVMWGEDLSCSCFRRFASPFRRSGCGRKFLGFGFSAF